MNGGPWLAIPGAAAKLAGVPGSTGARALSAGLILGTIAATAMLVVVSWASTGRLAWDTTTYLAAGERLNAGHELYALGDGDRWVWINPPYWSVPLLYPPTIAVLWQPLALLPGELAVPMWSIANSICLLLAVGFIVRRAGWQAGIVSLMLVPAFAWEIGVGNIHGFLLASLVLLRQRSPLGAPLIGLLAAIKLTPAVVIVWLWAVGRRREGTTATAVAIASLALSISSVGIPTFAAYLDAASRAAPSVLSVPGVLYGAGVPGARMLGWALTALLVVEIILLRRTGLAWAVAVAAMVLGSPVVNVPTYAVLLAAFPMRDSIGTLTLTNTTSPLPRQYWST